MEGAKLAQLTATNGTVLINGKTEPAVIYDQPGWTLDIALPNSMRDLIATNDIKSWILPEDVVPLLGLLPAKQYVSRIVLTDVPATQRDQVDTAGGESWHDSGVIFLSHATKHCNVAGMLLHQWAHIYRIFAQRAVRVHELAAQLEDIEPEFAAEDWAHNLGDIILGKDAEQFEEFVETAPLRALALADALDTCLRNTTGNDASTVKSKYEERVKYIRTQTRAAASQILQDRAAAGNQNAIRLMFYLELDSAVLLQAVEEIDLGGEILAEHSLQTLSALRQLKRLNLAGTAISRKPFASMSLPESLVELDLSNNVVEDLSGIENCRKLGRLILTDTQVQSYTLNALRAANPQCEIIV